MISLTSCQGNVKSSALAYWLCLYIDTDAHCSFAGWVVFTFVVVLVVLGVFDLDVARHEDARYGWHDHLL